MDLSKYREGLEERQKQKGPNSERAFWIQQIVELTDMKWKVVFGKTLHLPTHWIKDLYTEALDAKDKVSKRKKFWWLLKKTKV